MKLAKFFAAAALTVATSGIAVAADNAANNNNQGAVSLNCFPKNGFDDQIKAQLGLTPSQDKNDLPNGTVTLYTNEVNDSFAIVIDLSDAARAANNLPEPVSCIVDSAKQTGLKDFRSTPAYRTLFPAP